MTRSPSPLGTLPWLVGAVGLAAAVTLGTRAWGPATVRQAGAAVELAAGVEAGLAAERLPATAAPARPATAGGNARAAAVACPFQRIELAFGRGAPQAICLDATRVQQNGGVRSYLAAGSGAAAWALKIDIAGAELLRASLRTSDGRRFFCEAAGCSGLALGRHDARGLRSLALAALPLVPQERGSQDGPVLVSGRIAVPADDLLPGLACTGPSVAMNSPDGSARKFCGQGGAGVEIADDGTRHYRFEDAEGHSLAVSVNGEQRVTRVEYGSLACSGDACSGASMTAPAPERELSERSFFFGRTPLYAARGLAGSVVRPQLLLEGSLTLPSQE